jgi:PTH1 family peptidyl-tRNA hydrolase
MLSIIVGLGNIGDAYKGTRHNVGFELLDRVARALKARPEPDREYYRHAMGRHATGPIRLVWPTTLMNRSGWAVDQVLFERETEPSEMLVVVDDFNLPLGALRFRRDGSDGGHNGLESIIESIGSQDFPRLRLGIGPAPDNLDKAEFVLGRFTEDELKEVDRMLATATDAVLFAIDHRLELAMSKYNVNPARL